MTIMKAGFVVNLNKVWPSRMTLSDASTGTRSAILQKRRFFISRIMAIIVVVIMAVALVVSMVLFNNSFGYEDNAYGDYDILSFGTNPPHRRMFQSSPDVDSYLPGDAAIVPQQPFYASTLQESTIVVTLAFGNATQTNLVQRLVWSLRTNGAWEHGRIVIVTDQPNIYESWLLAQQKQSHGHHHTRIHILPAKESDLYPLNQKTKKVLEFKMEAIRFKRFKTLLLDYLDQAFPDPSSYQFAVYMDADVVVGRPLTSLLQDFREQMYKKGVFASAHSDEPTPLKITANTTQEEKDAFQLASLPFMSMFTDCATCARHNTNSGVILLHRKRSRRCLQDWRRLLEDGSSWAVYDQRFLRDLREDGHCKIHILPDHHRIYPTWKDMRLLQSTTIVHNTNSYNAKKIPPKVQASYFTHLLQNDQFSKVEFF